MTPLMAAAAVRSRPPHAAARGPVAARAAATTAPWELPAPLEDHDQHEQDDEHEDEQHGANVACAAMLRRRNASRPVDLEQVQREVAALELPEAVWRTCPWQPRERVDAGLRQWLRCAGAALREDQVIGMPSHAVDEAWHGLILCTARYAAFCEAAYGRFLHHHPEGGAPAGAAAAGGADEQLGRTIVAWSLVGRPGEPCLLWDLDARVDVREPWGVAAERVAQVQARMAAAR